MSQLMVATPLGRNAVSRKYTFNDGIEIRNLQKVRWGEGIVARFVSQHEQQDLADTRYWLCATKSLPASQVRVGENDGLYSTAREAMLALQIICPIGCKNIYFKLKTDRGILDIIDSWHHVELKNTFMGRVAYLEDQDLPRDFPKVFAGVKLALAENEPIRLTNPIILLEHALAVGTPDIGALLCVMGLDVLFGTQERRRFAKRLKGFLGQSTRIFPKAKVLNVQPKVTVEDVVADLYRFRGLIAHGKALPQEFLQPRDLLDDNNTRINVEPYYVRNLLHEAAVFLLALALRKVFQENWTDTMKNTNAWENQLQTYDRRGQAPASQPSLPAT